MQSSIKKWFSAMLLLMVAGSCNNVDFKKTKGGMPYKLFSDNKGEKVDTGNFLKVHIISKVKDSVLFNSHKTMPLYIPVSGQSTPYDISEVFPLLRKGDSVLAEQLVDTFLARNPASVPKNLKKGDKLVTTVKVLGVFKDYTTAQKDVAREQSAAFEKDTQVQTQLKKDIQAVTAYLTQNNINAQKIGKGTYIQVMQEGQGAPIQEGNYVTLRYKGYTFDGKVFDTNMDASKGKTEPATFQLGQTIKGFDEGLQALKKGAKARLFIPSTLAYGAQPPTEAIKPFENLIFDVEILDVQNTPPVQNNIGAPTGGDTSRNTRQ